MDRPARRVQLTGYARKIVRFTSAFAMILLASWSPITSIASPTYATFASCLGVRISPSANLQAIIDTNPPRTTFCFGPGTYRLTGTIQTRDKFPILDLRAGAIVDGQNRGYMGIAGADAPAGQAGMKILGGVFQHFGNATAPTWVSPFIVPRNGVVQGTEFRENYNAGFGIQGSNARVSNVYTHHNGRYGVVVTNRPSGIILEDSEIAFNNTRRLPTNADAGGTKFSGSDGMIVRRNKIHNNYGSGFWWDGSNRNALVYDNVISNNFMWGIRWEIGYGGLRIHNNTLTGNAVGGSWTNDHSAQICIANGDGSVGGIEIYNNTIDGTAHPITVIQTPGRTPPTKQVYVHDNLITIRSSTARIKGVGPVEFFSAAANNRFRSNDYRVPDPSGRYWVWRGQTLTWSQWHAYGQDQSGLVQRIT